MKNGDHSGSRADLPDIDTFRQDALAWLEANAERRPPARDLEWGKGSDDVSLFKNLSAADERVHIDALRDWQGRKSAAGYGSITWPVRYGGADLPAAYDQAFRAIEADFVTPAGHEALAITLDLVGPTILTIGDDAQKDRFLGPLRRTDEMWCQLFSEPGAGSDLASVSTRAVRDGDEWCVDGQKVWTSGAQFADFGYIICRTDPTAKKPDGLTAFLIPMDAHGVEVRPLRQMSGGSSFNEVFFSQLRVPDSARLGAVGDGWRVAITTLGFERAATARAGSSGKDIFTRLVLAAEHLGRSEEPAVRQALAMAYINVRVRSLTQRRVSETVKAGGVPGPEGSVGKLAWTDGLRQISDTASLVLGPSLTADSSVWGTFAWRDFVCGAPGCRIAGGSDEVQRNIIAERVLGLPKEPK
jgi:alkylation response protein AidB-like acyl-CoA dehydrogenase